MTTDDDDFSDMLSRALRIERTVRLYKRAKRDLYEQPDDKALQERVASLKQKLEGMNFKPPRVMRRPTW